MEECGLEGGAVRTAAYLVNRSPLLTLAPSEHFVLLLRSPYPYAFHIWDIRHATPCKAAPESYYPSHIAIIAIASRVVEMWDREHGGLPAAGPWGASLVPSSPLPEPAAYRALRGLPEALQCVFV